MAKTGILHCAKWKAAVCDFRKIGKGPAELLGYLEMMWMCSHANGAYEFSSKDEIEAVCCWEGESGVLADILIARRWIDQNGELYVIHDYEDHKPSYVVKRERDKDYAKNRRERQKNTPNSRQESSLVVNSRKKSSPSLTTSSKIVTLPNLTKPNLNTREISPNREISLLTPPSPPLLADASRGSEQPLGYGRGDVSPDSPNAILQLPCKSPSGKPRTHGITPKRIADFKLRFPTLDVYAEFVKARDWLEETPLRHKTPEEMPNWLVMWLRDAEAEASKCQTN